MIDSLQRKQNKEGKEEKKFEDEHLVKQLTEVNSLYHTASPTVKTRGFRFGFRKVIYFLSFKKKKKKSNLKIKI